MFLYEVFYTDFVGIVVVGVSGGAVTDVVGVSPESYLMRSMNSDFRDI